MGAELNNNSISNSNSLSGGKPDKSSKNIFGNSRTIGTLSKLSLELTYQLRVPSKPHILLHSSLLASITDITHMDKILLSPLNSNFGYTGFLNTIFLVK